MRVVFAKTCHCHSKYERRGSGARLISTVGFPAFKCRYVNHFFLKKSRILLIQPPHTIDGMRVCPRKENCLPVVPCLRLTDALAQLPQKHPRQTHGLHHHTSAKEGGHLTGPPLSPMPTPGPWPDQGKRGIAEGAMIARWGELERCSHSIISRCSLRACSRISFL